MIEIQITKLQEKKKEGLDKSLHCSLGTLFMLPSTSLAQHRMDAM